MTVVPFARHAGGEHDYPVYAGGRQILATFLATAADTAPIETRREARHRRRARRRAARGASVASGLVLIAVGCLLLLNNTGVRHLYPGRQAWALLLFVPAAGAAATAMSRYRAAGARATVAVVGAASSAAIFGFIGAMLLFDLDWGLLWPMLLIIPGLAALVGTRARAARDDAGPGHS